MKTKVFLVCTGLGRIRRGYEAFAQECFERLAQDPGLEMRLYRGGDETYAQGVAVRNLHRESPTAQALARLARPARPYFTPYYVEQLTFGLGLLPHLRRHRPDVVYFSDGYLGHVLWVLRRWTGLSHRLLFLNAGPSFSRFDHVQQVAPAAYAAAEVAGLSPAQQTLLPYGFRIPAVVPGRTRPQRAALRARLRARLRLPADRRIVLSVGAVNRAHKRMDYLVEELARLPAPRPYLVILGQQDEESPAVIRLAERRLGPENVRIETAGPEQVAAYYQAADCFALASLNEGFGRVYVEAMANGLPCLAHDFETARYVLGEEGYFGDFRQPGRLARLLADTLAREAQEEAHPRRTARHRHVFRRFGWQTLQPRYVELIRRVAAGQTPSGGQAATRATADPLHTVPGSPDRVVVSL